MLHTWEPWRSDWVVAPGWVHGDFGPQNLLIDPDSLAVTAIVDWELAGPGDPGTRMWRDRIAVTRAFRPGTAQA